MKTQCTPGTIFQSLHTFTKNTRQNQKHFSDESTCGIDRTGKYQKLPPALWRRDEKERNTIQHESKQMDKKFFLLGCWCGQHFRRFLLSCTLQKYFFACQNPYKLCGKSQYKNKNESIQHYSSSWSQASIKFIIDKNNLPQKTQSWDNTK